MNARKRQGRLRTNDERESSSSDEIYQRGAGALPFFSAIQESTSSGNNYNSYEKEIQLESMNSPKDM